MIDFGLHPLLQFALERYSTSAMRAVIILGGLYLLFWTFKRPWMDKFRVQTFGNHAAKPVQEAFYTFTTYAVYTLASVGVAIAAKSGHSMMYTDVNAYGLVYTISSFFIFCIWVDTFFYWSHLAMHKFSILYKTHSHHHKFINTTPWAAYAFHFGEAFINAGAFFLLMMIMPWHPTTLFVFVVFSVTYNGLIHLGYDLFPRSWKTHPIFGLLNTTTHHMLHHRYLNCNYGFIFSFWDKVMKTERLEVPVSNRVVP